ncbi:MAG: glycosyltransferase family 39 protein, partial [Bacteroidota bacterium]
MLRPIFLCTKDTLSKYYLLVAYVLIAVSILPRLANLDAPILDLNSFRQTQTAITVSSWLDDDEAGVEVSPFDQLLYYKTPLFGEPFFTQFEFPLYQYLTYLSVKMGVNNVDRAGRLVSIFFYFLSAAVLLWILQRLCSNRWVVIFSVFFYCFSLFSIFWSRTFSIEYCAVFFGLLHFYAFMRLKDSYKALWMTLGILAGTLSFLVKITSAFPFLLAMLFFLLREINFDFRRDLLQPRQLLDKLSINFTLVALAGLLVFVPLVFELLWLSHTDGLKE